MPFIPHSPESLLPRSDSKNPATTCKGITSTGRPCRRPLGTSRQSTRTTNQKSWNGAVAFLQPSDEFHEGAAAFFCWQHQEQAASLANASQEGRKSNVVVLNQRTSIDTLAERLGVLEVGGEVHTSRGKHRRHQTRPARKETLPRSWQDLDGPLLAVSSDERKPRQAKRKQSRSTKGVTFSLFCCGGTAYGNGTPSARVHRHTEKLDNSYSKTAKVPSSINQPGHLAPTTPILPQNLKVSASGSPLVSHTTHPNRPTTDTGRPGFLRENPSQTQALLSYIPRTLAPEKTSLLLAELAKPLSPHDEEGYVYMFWLTDAANVAPGSETATSLLADTVPSTPHGRRKSDVLQAYSAQLGTAKCKKILLKIGRASNVHRRMNEWTRQCGYNLSLIRFYPYVATSSRPGTSAASAPSSTPRKVPHAHKVERLIHLELADQRVKRDCESCGKEHREWFEVNSSREGLRKVDEVIKRWVGWAQENHAS